MNAPDAKPTSSTPPLLSKSKSKTCVLCFPPHPLQQHPLPQAGAQDVGSVDGGRVVFFGCKGETHTHKQGFKQLFRRLRTMFKPERLDSPEDFRQDHLKGAQILVFGCPREKYTEPEIEVLRRYVRAGGSVLVLLSEGGYTLHFLVSVQKCMHDILSLPGHLHNWRHKHPPPSIHWLEKCGIT